MAIVGEYLYLGLPTCKMALKSTDGRCSECQSNRCCALSERTVRLVSHGKITPVRHAETKVDLEQTCPLASAYHDWLLESREHLRIPAASFKRSRRERKEAVFAWLRQAATRQREEVNWRPADLQSGDGSAASFKRSRRERKEAVFAWLRQAACSSG